MKAVVYKGPFSVAVEDVPDPQIEEPNDAPVRITTTNICGSGLQMRAGPMSSLLHPAGASNDAPTPR